MEETKVILTSGNCEVCKEQYEHKPGLPPLCDRHLDMLSLMMWALPRIKVQQKIVVPQIIIPNGRGN